MLNPDHFGGSGTSNHNDTNNNNNTSSSLSPYDSSIAAQEGQGKDVFIPESPSHRTLQLWHDVAYDIDKTQTGTCCD